MSEKNPNHPVTRAMREQWHKIAAILVHKTGRTEAVISPRDIEEFIVSGCTNVTIRELPDGIHVRLVSDEEAARLAKKEGGLPA